MNINFSEKLREILTFSREEAIRLGNEYITIEHLFLGILREGESHAIVILEKLSVDLQSVRKEIELQLRQSSPLSEQFFSSIPFNKSAEKILRIITLEAKSMNSAAAEAEHLLLAILKDTLSLTTQILQKNNITYTTVKNHIQIANPENKKSTFDDDDDDEIKIPQRHQPNKPRPEKQSETPVLDNFGIDLTKAAEEGRLDLIVGRENEIERIAQILSRRKKNNPILIGEPGVGKSAIAEGLAMRIVHKQVSRILFNKRVLTLDLASIVAGTKYRGQFEERMKAMLNELARSKDVILFIDEIHTIVGAGGASGSLDAANMLKPALARGEIQCIGATTLNEYRQHIEKDGALERRFQKVMVEPATVDEAINILNNIKKHYENHHGVLYTDEAITACVKLTHRYISDRHLPDKAIDALDEAGSRVHIQNIQVPTHIIELEEQLESLRNQKIDAVRSQQFELAASFRDNEKELLRKIEENNKKWQEMLATQREPVTEQDVALVVAMMTGVPVNRIAQEESSRLLKMFAELQGSVVGQDKAIQQIVKAIQRNRAGLKDPRKPIGSFIFLGPTGVGKTQLAKVLSEYLFDSKDALIRIDMSEYMEKFAVSRLVGAPPGYVGYEEGGQLTEKIRRKPYSVVLLDEIEKAHPDVFHILLQVLDEGHLTDSYGRKVDFKNTIIIMTSNIGTRELTEFGSSVGFSQKSKEEQYNEYSKAVVEKALKKAFAPEFLNRIDDLIQFNALNKENIYKIIDIELQELFARIRDLNITLSLSQAAREFIVEKGYDQKFGARPLKRAIQKYIEDPMAEFMLNNSLKGNTNVLIDYVNEKITVSKITKKRKSKQT
ncbi:MAG: ATP-dependent Clp protease ATP-binding subunit [Bacteroidales bacterium]|nr:ATP-dependent Clp protease ATP-binding subunit [Bacteroidales bacterium]NLK80792.1 ATP-dependent Clp protease ATP-binding subunit [Bacteroidales bacterium]